MEAALCKSRAYFCRVLVKTKGNITRAANELGISKPYAMWLVKHFGLNDWARSVRVSNGGPLTGRPKNSLSM